MAAAPLMLAMGVGQGIMAYQQGREESRVAKANAQHAREMQAYEAQIKKTNVALIQGEERRAAQQQEYANRAAEGGLQATMGATGVAVTGTFMDVLGEQVMLGQNKLSQLRSQSLRQQTGVINSGNMAIYKQELAEYQYMQQARQAKKAAVMGLAMGVVTGAAGFAQQSGSWSILFSGGYFSGLFGGGNTGSTLLSQQSPSQNNYNSPLADLFFNPGWEETS